MIPAYLAGIVTVVCLTVLTALHDVDSSVTIPIIAGLAGGGAGHIVGKKTA